MGMKRMLCLLAAMLLLCTACAPTTSSYDDETDALLEQAIAAINADDDAALLALFSEAVASQDEVQEAVRSALSALTDRIDRFERIGAETTPYLANGETIYQTYAHYDLYSATAHYALFLACWHSDGTPAYPNSEEIGLHTLRLVEDADCAKQYNGWTEAQLDTAGFYYRPSRLQTESTTYQGAFRVTDEQGTVWLTNEHVRLATAMWQTNGEGNSIPVVQITLTEEGAAALATATRRNLYGVLPIYIGEECVAEPVVQAVIEDGMVILSGYDLFETYDDAVALETYFNTYAG